jgi:hypothetical protein
LSRLFACNNPRSLLSFTFSQLAKLRKLAKNINVVVEGIANNPSCCEGWPT